MAAKYTLSDRVRGFLRLFSSTNSSTNQPETARELPPQAATGAASTEGIRRATVPKGRQSQENAGFRALWNAVSTFDGFENETRRAVIECTRAYANTDDDVSGTRADFIALVNAGYVFSFEGSERAKKQAEELTKILEKRVYKEGGGLNGFINQQIGEMFDTGQLSAEFYADEARSCVEDVAVVLPEDVEARRNEDDEWDFYQRYNVQGGAGDGIFLSPATYSSIAFSPRKNSPYGTPIALGAIGALSRKERVHTGIDRLIEFIAEGNLINVTLPAFSPKDFGLKSESDPAYITAVKNVSETLTKLIVDRASHSVITAPTFRGGKVEVEVIPVSREASGVAEVELANERQVWSAMPTANFLRGQTENVTQALSKVVWLILVAQAEIAQGLVRQHIEKLVNLNLRLAGIAAVAEMGFLDPKNPFEVDQADANLKEAQADEILGRLLGAPYLEKLAEKHELILTPEQLNELAGNLVNEPTPPSEPNPTGPPNG